MKNTMLKRLLSFVMVLSMVMSYTVMPVAAETTDVDPEHTHNYTAGEPVAATCTVDGYTTYTCTVEGCGDNYASDFVTAIGHSYENGTCTACGNPDPDYVAPIEEDCNHVWDAGETTAATCTAPGSTVYTCTVEGCEETRTETIEALCHNFAEGSCSVCGAVDPEFVVPCNHIWNEGETIAATCTAPGSTVYTCTVEGCEETRTETIEALCHNFAEGSCSVCGAADPDYEVPAQRIATLYFADLYDWSIVTAAFADAEGNVLGEAQEMSYHSEITRQTFRETVTYKFYSVAVPEGAVTVTFSGSETILEPVTIPEAAEGLDTWADGWFLLKDLTAEDDSTYESDGVIDTEAELVTALVAGGTITLGGDITLNTAITVIDGTTIDLNNHTLYVNVENSIYNNAAIKNGNIVLGKDDVHVCDGYFLVNASKTLTLNSVKMTSSAAGIKGYAVFHLKTGAHLDLTNSNLTISNNEYAAGYIVYAGEKTATVDMTGSSITGSMVNGIVHATTTINNSTVELTDVVEHGINRSAVTVTDSTVKISGGTGRGITAQHGNLVISGNSTVTITDMGEATIELRNNKNLMIAETAKVTVDDAVKKDSDSTDSTINGDVTTLVKNPVAKVGETGYATLQEAINDANGAEITLQRETAETITIADNAAVVINMNGKTLTGRISPCNASSLTISNGSIKNPDASVSALEINAGELTLTNMNIDSARHAVRIDGAVTATIDGGTYKGAIGTGTGTYYAVNVSGAANVTIKDGIFVGPKGTTADSGAAVNAQAGSTVTIENGTFSGGKNSTLSAAGTLTVKGGIYDQDVSAYVSDGYVALPDLNGNYIVGSKPTATVNNLGPMTIPESEYNVYGGSKNGDMPLSFVMQFLADQKEADMATSPFADWYGDFVITFTGIKDGSFTADGCYLAGHYGSFGWVKVPVDGMSIQNGMRYPVMLGVGMGQKYEYICSGVQDFKCAMYLTPDVLKNNPELEVKLELNIVDNSQGSEAAASALVSGESIYEVTYYKYGVEDFAIAKITDANGNVIGSYTTLQAAVNAVQAGETITILEKATLTETVNVPEGKNFVLNMNGATLTGSIQAPNTNLTVKDGSIKNPDASVSAIEVNAGSLTLTNMNIDSARHAVRIDGAVTATIDGGTYRSAIGNGTGTYHAVNVSGTANVTIKDGIFVGPKGTTADSGAAVNAQAGSTVTIKNGTFSGGKNSTLSAAGTLTVKGGIYDQDVTHYCEKDRKAVKNANGMYEIVDRVYVAQVGEDKFETITDAIAVANGAEIILLENTAEIITINAGATVVINMNGKTLTGNISAPNANLTVQNGSIVNTNQAVSALEINAGTLTLTNVNMESARHAVRIDGAVTAAIDGGTYKVTEAPVSHHTINVSGSASATISNVTVLGPAGTASASANGGSAVQVRDTAKVTINSGKFSGGVNDTLVGHNADNLVVMGGIYDQDPAAYVANGYCVKEVEAGYEVGKTEMVENPASNATCTEPAKIEHYQCKFCGKTFSADDHTTEITVTVGTSLGHNITGPWLYDTETGANGHYQKCVNGCGTKGEMQDHQWSEWQSANTRSTVQEQRSCQDCGYVETRSVHVHDYVIDGYTDAGHELICSDTDCNKDADAKKTVNHSLTIDSNQDGQLDKCICGYSTVRHVHNLDWKYNSSKHWQECTSKDGLTCDHKEVKENHIWGSWEKGKADGSSKSSWCHKECEICGYIIERHVVWSYSDNPKTGDYIAIAFGVMFFSAATLVVLMAVKKKKR